MFLEDGSSGQRGHSSWEQQAMNFLGLHAPSSLFKGFCFVMAVLFVQFLSTSAVDQLCLDPHLHVARNWVVRCRSSTVPHSLLVVDSSCSDNWCLCCHQMGQSWRIWWTVCSGGWNDCFQCGRPMLLGCVIRTTFNLHSSGYSARCLTSLGLIWCQYIVTGRDSKFDL